jgi:helix-turn-helix protein
MWSSSQFRQTRKKTHADSFYVLDAVSADHDIHAYINLLRRDGNLTIVGAPAKPLEEGSSFRRALDEARHQLARHYLNNSVLELDEAAYLLGYEDGNSFVRAFRTWEGVPPARWREQQRAQAAS